MVFQGYPPRCDASGEQKHLDRCHAHLAARLLYLVWSFSMFGEDIVGRSWYMEDIV